MVCRGACINDHTLIRLDQLRAGSTDSFLFRQLMGVARGKGEFIRAWHRDSSTTMSSANPSRSLQNDEVTPHRCTRRINLYSNIFQRCKLHLLQVLTDAVLTFSGLHLYE